MSAYHDGYEIDDDFDADEGLVCSPANCGDCWMGDGLCREEIDALSQETKSYHERYVRENVTCSGCGATLTQYEIPADDLWVWPGVWPEGVYYSPMIALDIFAVYDAPKGEVHEPVKDGASIATRS